MSMRSVSLNLFFIFEETNRAASEQLILKLG